VGADRWDEQVGSVADEASRLLESLRRSTADAPEHAAPRPGGAGGRHRPAPGAHAAGGEGHGRSGPEESGPPAPEGFGHPGPEGFGHPGPEGFGHPGLEGLGDGPGCADPFCRYCPLCRSAAVIRALSPETLARLADLATVAATVLADLASTRGSNGDGEEGAARPPRPSRPEPSAPQPIPVRDDDPEEEAPRG
jgi:hypothetical protein